MEAQQAGYVATSCKETATARCDSCPTLAPRFGGAQVSRSWASWLPRFVDRGSGAGVAKSVNAESSQASGRKPFPVRIRAPAPAAPPAFLLETEHTPRLRVLVKTP